MPHIARYKFDDKFIPSVNTVTGSLSLEGLIRNYYRKHGFKWCDKDSGKAKERGSALAEFMEELRKTGKLPKAKKYFKVCMQNWIAWFEQSPAEILADRYVEPHLVNTVEGYHGSPDVILHSGQEPVLADDKCKKRFSDYRLLMNEHAYAMCDSIDLGGGKIEKLPWEVPIKQFIFFTYHPVTGKLYPEEHTFSPDCYKDFLTCKAMHEVNKTSEWYFGRFATLLPEELNGSQATTETDKGNNSETSEVSKADTAKV